MCGYLYNVTELPLLDPLLEIAGYDESEISDIIQNPFLRPTDTVINLVPTRHGLKMKGATWWLATHEDGSPNTRLTSFNSKAGRLETAQLHLAKPRSIRSIIIAQGFCEWQPIFKGGYTLSQLPINSEQSARLKPQRKVQHLITHADQPIMLLGAVSKMRLKADGTPAINTSVITLPPHAEFLDIHSKSFPLVLNPDELVDWLNPALPLSSFQRQLEQTSFRQSFNVMPVDAQLKQSGDAFVIKPTAS